MTKQAALSSAETEILNYVWQLERATVQNICDELPSDRNITYATVQTLLRRLEKKGYVEHTTEGKAHVFTATVEQEEVANQGISDLVKKLFRGDTSALMLHMAKHGKISRKDLDHLNSLLNEEK